MSGPRHQARFVVGFILLAAALAACAPAASPGAPPAGSTKPAASGAPGSSAATATATPAPPERMRVSWSSAAISYLPLHVAQDRGMFAERGLDVELLFTQGAQAVSALVAGELDIAYSDGSGLVRARLAGAETLIFGVTTNVIPQKVIGHASLQRVEDLRGKRLGVTRPGSLPDFAARYLLRSVGLQPDTDVAFVQAGTGPEVVASLTAGAIDAAVTGEPAGFYARQQGFVVLYDLTRLPIEYPSVALGSTRRVLDERPAVLRAFMAGLIEGIAWTKANRAEALDRLATLTKIDDREALAVAYDEFVPSFPEAPYPTTAGIATVLDTFRETEPRAADARAADFIDERVVRDLDQSGYIRQVYR